MKKEMLLSIAVVVMLSMSIFTYVVNDDSLNEDDAVSDIPDIIVQNDENSNIIELSTAYLGKTYHINSNIKTLVINGKYTLTNEIRRVFNMH